MSNPGVFQYFNIGSDRYFNHTDREKKNISNSQVFLQDHQNFSPVHNQQGSRMNAFKDGMQDIVHRNFATTPNEDSNDCWYFNSPPSYEMAMEQLQRDKSRLWNSTNKDSSVPNNDLIRVQNFDATKETFQKVGHNQCFDTMKNNYQLKYTNEQFFSAEKGPDLKFGSTSKQEQYQRTAKLFTKQNVNIADIQDINASSCGIASSEIQTNAFQNRITLQMPVSNLIGEPHTDYSICPHSVENNICKNEKDSILTHDLVFDYDSRDLEKQNIQYESNSVSKCIFIIKYF
ncbi:hypothetical protein CDAR_498401 [Caerostris darwini]|uniref:Uncharacterized protein n=1 Tax=Caerostris darwini TaxID=1538125 RepID=A0AAV4PQK6_9ARAC|nr:hypothetical protein CDAR_498401 [Caerostris darwini]